MQYDTSIDNLIGRTGIGRMGRSSEPGEFSATHIKEFELFFSTARDSVTNLPGLREFFYEAGVMVSSHPDLTFGVIIIDIYQFKAVNEFCGRKKGDEILHLISDLFTKYEEERPCTKSGHARADNFLMCTAFKNERELTDIVKYMYHTITTFPFPYKIAPAFGICYENEPLPAVSYLKDCAEIALNSVKGKFYSYYAIFDDNMRRQIIKEKQVEHDIIKALKDNEVMLYIQPKVDMSTEKICGGEALTRWQHNDMGLISPHDFIPVLEKNGFIIQLDYFIWEKVFKYLNRLKREGLPLIPISINISRAHVHDEDLYEMLTHYSRKYDIPPEYVPLEITESAFELKERVLFENIKLLRDYGFKIAMDDFGTGYSSLQLVSSQELDEIKIDGSLIAGADTPKGKIVLRSLISMLKELGTDFVAEGVETEEQKEMLLEYGCDRAQGYLFMKPVPFEEFDKKYKDQKEK